MSQPTPPLVLHLFGPFAARVDGRPLPRLRSRRSVWLLALLLLHHPRPLDRSFLASLLWPDGSETRALYNLRRNLADLRRSLASQAGRLLSPTPRSLALDLHAASVDLLAFDAALARADAPSLRQAVSLYRGPLLEDCHEPWLLPERARRETACLHALETLAEQARRRGDLPAAEADLRRALVLEPFRESAARALMCLLAEGGRLAAAQQVYHELRERLHRQLNAAPDPETSALYQRIRQPPAALPGQAKDSSRKRERSESAKGGGSERRASAGSSLPHPPTPLIGRERALAEAAARLSHREARLLTLTGPAGVGKTRLALQIAADHQDDFADGVYFVDLTPLSEPGRVMASIAQGLGVREQAGEELSASVKRWVGERELLLVLDNFEHVLEAAGEVAGLLERGPGLKVLVTSRAALRVRAEQLLEVEPLPIPPAAEVASGGCRVPREEIADPAGGTQRRHGERGARSVERLLAFPSVALFVERVAAVRPGYALTEADGEAIASICRRLEGLPLAIELAAAQIRLLSPSELLARLDRRLPLPAPGYRDMPARHRTLRDAMRWSYDLLSEAEQRLFRRSSVFVGGWTREASAAVCAPDDESAAATTLASLLDQSLVRQSEHAGTSRFSMLEMIREFARERLAESGEASVLRRRHAEFFTDWAEALTRPGWGREAARVLDWLEREHDNLRTALVWALEVGASSEETEAAALGVRLAAALIPFWEMRGYRTEGRDGAMRLLALPAASERTAVRARALYVAGRLSHERIEHLQRAHELCTESMEIWREVGDRPRLAESLHFLSHIYGISDHHAAARGYAEESLAIYRELGDRRGTAGALSSLGGVGYRTGDLDTAWEKRLEAVSILRELGDQAALWGTLMNLEMAARHRGDDAASRPLVRECLEIARALGDREKISTNLGGMGGIAYEEGDLDTAERYYQESLDLAREQRHQLLCNSALIELARVTLARGELATARSLLEDARDAAIAWSRGHVFHPEAVARAWAGLGAVAVAEGDLAAAVAAYRESLALWPQWRFTPALPRFGPKWGIVGCLDGLAAVARRQGDPLRAARLFGATAGLRDAIGRRLALPEAERREREVAAAREMLGEGAFAAAWAEGTALSLEAAVALALEVCGGKTGGAEG